MIDLFGNEVVQAKKGDRKSVIAHKQLIALHGETAGKKCGACFHFYYRVYSKKYPKCDKSGCDGASQNNDWSSRWQACGLFEEEEKILPSTGVKEGLGK